MATMAGRGQNNIADDNDNDSLLHASDSEMETETLPDLDRDMTETGPVDGGDAAFEFVESPADGYFSNRDIPQHTFVQYSPVQAEADRKAREAAQIQAETDGRRPSTRASASIGTVSSPVFSGPAATHEAMLDAGPAPPDYAAATAHRHTSSQTPQGYESFQGAALASSHEDNQDSASLTQHRPGTRLNDLYWPFGDRHPFRTAQVATRQTGGLGSREAGYGAISAQSTGSGRSSGHPESMSDTRSQIPDEETGLLQQRKRRKRSTYWGYCLKFMLILLVIAVIAIAGQALNERTETGVPSDQDDTVSPLPITSPAPPTAPSPSNTPAPPTPIMPPSRTCPYSSVSSSVAFDFTSPDSFSLRELLARDETFEGNVQGRISISPANPAQEPGLRVWVTYAATAPWRVSTVKFARTETSLDLELPQVQKLQHTSSSVSCLHLDILIEVKQGLVLEEFHVTTSNLDLWMDEALFNYADSNRNLRITGQSSLSTISGQIRGAWSSRDTKIESNSGSVTGAFAWRDLLSIRTNSGTIDVGVYPKEADPQHIAPAEYIAYSTSGSIRTDTQIRDFDKGELPIREYKSRVETRSGQISGTYIHGIATSFSTTSAAINVDVQPIDTHLIDSGSYTFKARKTTLGTDTFSGSTTLRLLPPLSPSNNSAASAESSMRVKQNPVIDTLKSKHKSKSGSMFLTYPEAWTGEIEAESLSGSITVGGKGLRDPYLMSFFSHFFARKGDGDSALSVSTTSAGINIFVGET